MDPDPPSSNWSGNSCRMGKQNAVRRNIKIRKQQRAMGYGAPKRWRVSTFSVVKHFGVKSDTTTRQECKGNEAWICIKSTLKIGDLHLMKGARGEEKAFKFPVLYNRRRSLEYASALYMQGLYVPNRDVICLSCSCWTAMQNLQYLAWLFEVVISILTGGSPFFARCYSVQEKKIRLIAHATVFIKGERKRKRERIMGDIGMWSVSASLSMPWFNHGQEWDKEALAPTHWSSLSRIHNWSNGYRWLLSWS